MIFAANLKCNHTRASFEKYADCLNSARSAHKIMVFPPATAFLRAEFNFILGAQNFYPAPSGSFTGEIGSDMLDEFGVKCVLIGHSERRAMGESDALLRAKFDYAASRGYEIVYCIGESDITRMNGLTQSFLSDQMEQIDASYEKLIVAYEPIWAIGAGKSAKIEQIAEVLEFLRVNTGAALLYGGSVNSANVAEICAIKDCDGVLVGTASWDAQNFLNLIKDSKC